MADRQGLEVVNAIAIANYDFRASGTVAKSIEIAGAVQKAGLQAELWAVRDQGAFRDRIPEGVSLVEIGRQGLPRMGRGMDLASNVPALGMALRARMPSVFLSGGNHFHIPARLALAFSARRRMLRFGIRASNSSLRPNPRTGAVENRARTANRLKYGGADFIGAVSNELTEEILSENPALDVSSIPNGVDLGRIARLMEEPFAHRFFAEDAGDLDKRPVLTTMGRITYQKGFDVLVRALSHLHYRTRARLLIIGDGSKVERQQLLELIAKLRLSNDVDLLGFQANPFGIIAKSDVFVSASRWEGSSNSLIEALACGAPLVATDCPTGNRDILQNGRYGTLAPIGNPEALAEAIARELAVRRSRGAQAAAARAFDLQSCVDQWVSVLAKNHHVALKIRRDR